MDKWGGGGFIFVHFWGGGGKDVVQRFWQNSRYGERIHLFCF